MALYMILSALLFLQLLNSVKSQSSACIEAFQDLTSSLKCYNAFVDVLLRRSSGDACSSECTRLIVNYVDQCSSVSKLCSYR